MTDKTTQPAPLETGGLPELPEGRKMLSELQSGVDIVYSGEQMRAYAEQAIVKACWDFNLTMDEALGVASRVAPQEPIGPTEIQSPYCWQECSEEGAPYFDEGTFSDDPNFFDYSRPLYLAPARPAALLEPPYPLNEYAIDQWWVAELESIHGSLVPLTMDQYRAINVARNFIRAALAAPAVAVDPLVAEIEPETSVHQVEQSSVAAAALGLLAGAERWIRASPHGENCFLHDDGGEYDACFCGRDSLLNAIDDALAAPARPAAPQEPNEVSSLLDQLCAASDVRSSLHREYMGKAMSNDVFARFDGARTKVGELTRRIVSLCAAPAALVEPIAEVGPDFTLRWVGNEPIAKLLAMHPGVWIGSKLYAAPGRPAVLVEPARSTEKQLSDKRITDLYIAWSNRTKTELITFHAFARELIAADRALFPEVTAAAPAVAVDPLVAEIEPETSVHQVEQSSVAAAALGLMKGAFRTTESTGGRNRAYKMVFAFPDMETLHTADDQWRAFVAGAAQ